MPVGTRIKPSLPTGAERIAPVLKASFHHERPLARAHGLPVRNTRERKLVEAGKEVVLIREVGHLKGALPRIVAVPPCDAGIRERVALNVVGGSSGAVCVHFAPIAFDQPRSQGAQLAKADLILYARAPFRLRYIRRSHTELRAVGPGGSACVRIDAGVLEVQVAIRRVNGQAFGGAHDSFDLEALH